MMGVARGGGENFDLNIARQFIGRGHNVKVYTGSPIFKQKINIEDFNVKYISSPYFRGFHYRLKQIDYKLINKVSGFFLKLDLFCFQILLFYKIKNCNWADIYQISGMPYLGAWLEKRGKTSIIRWAGPTTTFNLESMKLCSANIANGNAYEIIKNEIYPPIKFIDIGVDSNYFEPIIKKDEKIVTFLFVGRIIPIKNIPFMISAFVNVAKNNTNIKLNIVGSGEAKEEEKIKNLILKTKSAKYIKLCGEKRGLQLLEYYQNSDCFIITSNYDNFPNVVLEAMSCGLPIIGTNVGGISQQIFHNHNGFLITNKDSLELEKAITIIAKSKSIRKNYGDYSRRVVIEKYSWEKTATSLIKLYNKIIEEKGVLF